LYSFIFNDAELDLWQVEGLAHNSKYQLHRVNDGDAFCYLCLVAHLLYGELIEYFYFALLVD
jgi:hypothetical protein